MDDETTYLRAVTAALALTILAGCGDTWGPGGQPWTLSTSGTEDTTVTDAGTADSGIGCGRDGRDLERRCPKQRGVCAGATVTCRDASYPNCTRNEYGPDYVPSEGPGHCDGLDNDCDGEVDERCNCTPGQSRQCYGATP